MNSFLGYFYPVTIEKAGHLFRSELGLRLSIRCLSVTVKFRFKTSERLECNTGLCIRKSFPDSIFFDFNF